jgi:serine/threonine protein kinase
VKPQNILVTSDDHVKVTDFGIAQALSLTQPEEKQNVVWGSPHYFAPEQASGETPTPASDVYSIGIVLFEMLTGKLPYNGNDQQELALAHIRDAVPHVMDFNVTVPVHLDRIIYKVMSKEPAARYRTADQLGRILISYQKQGSDPTANIPLPVSKSQPQAPIVQSPIPPAPQIQQSYQPQPQQYTPPPQQAQIPQRQNVYGGQTPPPQAPYIPPAQQGNTPLPYAPARTGQTGRLGTGPGNSANPYGAPPYNPATAPMPYGQEGSGPRKAAPDYQPTAPPPSIDLVSVILAFIAFIAIMGLLPLWVMVWNTWINSAGR